MRIGIDSSVLVAAMHGEHPMHAVAARWLDDRLSSDELCVTHHSVLECYAVLTRLPGQLRITGDEAHRLIGGTVRRNMELAGFESEWTWSIIDLLAERHVMGGRSYDVFAVEVLRRCGIEAIATFNRQHFVDIAPDLLIIDPAVPTARSDR